MAPPLAVYIHIPFCTVKCGYCDFNAYAGMDALQGAYAKAVVAEMEHYRDRFGRSVTSVAFGGGTPGETPPELLGAILDSLRSCFAVDPAADVSLEANPGTTTAAAFHGMRQAGVTRVSLGAQSFVASELKFLDRIHSPEAVGGAVSLARREGFASLNLDLIYAIPAQSLASWQLSLQSALALGPDHISTYALTVEEGTPLASRVEGGEVAVPGSDETADLYEFATETLLAAGFEQYELSNWAKPGHRSRHNLTYWTDGEYLGLGAGAHGYLGGERYENVAHPRHYIAAVQAGNAVAQVTRPDRRTAIFDWLSLRLRLLDGFRPGDFEARFGAELEDIAGPPFHRAADAGLLEWGETVHLTRAGRLLHGEISVDLLVHLRATCP